MRWKKWSDPVAGDKRISKHFAFFPTGLTDGYVVWLEQYSCLEEFYIQGRDWDTANWKIIKSWSNDSEIPEEAQCLLDLSKDEVKGLS